MAGGGYPVGEVAGALSLYSLFVDTEGAAFG